MPNACSCLQTPLAMGLLRVCTPCIHLCKGFTITAGLQREGQALQHHLSPQFKGGLQTPAGHCPASPRAQLSCALGFGPFCTMRGLGLSDQVTAVRHTPVGEVPSSCFKEVLKEAPGCDKQGDGVW